MFFRRENPFTKAIRKLGEVPDDQIVNQFYEVFKKIGSMHSGQVAAAHGALSALAAAYPDPKAQGVISEFKQALKVQAVYLAHEPYLYGLKYDAAARNERLRAIFGTDIPRVKT